MYFSSEHKKSDGDKEVQELTWVGYGIASMKSLMSWSMLLFFRFKPFCYAIWTVIIVLLLRYSTKTNSDQHTIAENASANEKQIGNYLKELQQMIDSTNNVIVTKPANASATEKQTGNYLKELQQMIDSTNNVIITMPAKAAGTSLKAFTKQCFNGTYWDESRSSNFLNFIKGNGHKDLTDSYEMPRVMASHMYNSESFVHLIKNVPSQTLMIYSHREETDRLLSSIDEVVTNWCRGYAAQGNDITPPMGFFSKQDKNTHTCHVSERMLIEKAIKPKFGEIGFGLAKILTCNVYDALEGNAPKFLFMEYKKADKLMNRLAEKYCPNLVDEPVKANIADEKTVSLFVQVQNKKTRKSHDVSLKEWMNNKREYIELMMGLNDGASCRAKTRVMESMLFSSDDGFVNAAEVVKEFWMMKFSSMFGN